jgi:hypothetical protein
MIAATLAALAALCSPPIPTDAEVLRPVIASVPFDSALALQHDDGGVTLIDVGLVAVSDGQAAIMPIDRIETVWKDANNREHRVVTEYSADRDPVDTAKRHARRVAALEALFPPVPSRPQ